MHDLLKVLENYEIENENGRRFVHWSLPSSSSYILAIMWFKLFSDGRDLVKVMAEFIN